ncbi:Crp/Fnr family transcriptional regulator [Marinobacterium aestuariivivens]|uniref:Crp/Fnr family transcriptional regulator n=1 Tax=Marinobacterium aestuariivivens TaxID=1698799 RepID=A0ABW2A2S3_9GAMM
MKEIDAQALWQARGPAFFRELSTFGALSDRVVRRILVEGRVLQLDRGEVLYRAGDAVQSFYVVLRGSLSMYVCDEDHYALARRHLQGEQLGFVPMIGLHDHTATAVGAEDETLLVEISADQFYELHVSEPDDFGLLLLNLAREMARAIGALSRTIVELSLQMQKGRQPG